MQYKTALTVILILAIGGVLFSGYLSYYELFVPGGCDETVVSCGTKNITIADLPACVYGLLMYSIILVIDLIALISNKKKVE